GLMLVFRALEVGGQTLMPSFTFSASAHAVAWNGSEPRFTECDPDTFQMDVDDGVERAKDVDAVLATHVFGAPCNIDALVEAAQRFDVPLVFDAAHAFGARLGGRPVAQFGTASIFSMTPTKPLVAGEGGLVATSDSDLAHRVRIGRDYGNPGNYDTQFVGLNGRMSEMHAATALASLDTFTEQQRTRDDIALRYRNALRSVPGIRVQHIPEADTSTFKDLTIAISPGEFGVDRDTLRVALHAEGVDTRCYFDPPVHRQTAYSAVASGPLPVTERVAGEVLSLPIYPDLSLHAVDRIVDLIATVHDFADEVRDRPS
ncbi:MAG TPA: DegT/DnrJ/EryC1/StrS family aminotransferase, partial [Acidimicrobiia bacterium]|nr:DegT/DnrJ/EryC1/StrS family aminotransferase [Acidimicrobiia bacterium]